MTRHPLFGLALAAFGALVLTPDAMFLRLSEMSGPQMMGWRGIFMGSSLTLLWLLTSRTRGADLALLASGAGIAIVGCQFVNSALFALGIGAAPVAIVLFGVATTPIWAALLAWAFLGERTPLATWITIAAVSIGIGIAVLGGEEMEGTPGAVLFGAVAGLGVAMMLAANFVVLRARPALPIPLLIGLGALCAGAAGVTATGPAQMTDGNVWAIAITGCIILPVSFLSLSIASRHTAAANVSLLLLLETVLGPAWVWLVLGETLTPRMLVGGAVVVVAIALYLLHARRRARRGPAKATQLAAK
ncbi:DMT family transporter [Roseovarius aquimarinus]|uniref:DMT family transporter n=1 Tax=Roseovarius aquimarinus TaxID=1229156 RepID=A0ABW7I9X0_9RHOB